MRKLFALFAAVTFFLAACKKNINDEKQTVNATDEQDQKISPQQINDFIMQRWNEKGSFSWDEASDVIVWGALQNSDKIASIGYKPADEATDISKKITLININEAKWKAAKQQVLQLIYNEEKIKNPNLKIEDLEVWKEKKLPVIDVKIESIKTIKLLRQSNLVRYVEPMGYDPIEAEDNRSEFSIFDGSGCGSYSGDNGLINGVDYTVITPNAKASWNYGYHGIQNAWTKSTGAGVKIMVIDTGIDPDQDNLGSEFNQGLSSGRTLEKIHTLGNAADADDRCGHGTTMCGEAAAPRCTDGNSCGVAYNCNLVSCRASKDVFIDESTEVKGVSDAYTWAGDNTSVKITSMSTGRITTSSQIKDAIDYAYAKGKLMFCAGGTSFAWTSRFVGVIFPANLSNVLAITGVTDTSSLKACSDCHKGKQIDFVIVMEKTSNKLHALSTARSGDVPTTVGGSSVATSTAAGIAALVWSRFPSYTREKIVNKLIVTASSYPNKTANFGWGKLNADAATN